MIVVPITGISFRRVSGAVLEDCRRRVEQVEIKSALRYDTGFPHRGAQSVRVPRSGYAGTSRRAVVTTARSCKLFGGSLESRRTAKQVFRSTQMGVTSALY